MSGQEQLRYELFLLACDASSIKPISELECPSRDPFASVTEIRSHMLWGKLGERTDEGLVSSDISIPVSKVHGHPQSFR